MCIQQILQNVEDFKLNTKNLKKNSPYFPKVLFKNEEGFIVAASTLVRKQNDNGIWYTIHCVERMEIPIGDYGKHEVLMERLIQNAYIAKCLHIIIEPYDEIDALQISEEDRIRQMFII